MRVPVRGRVLALFVCAAIAAGSGGCGSSVSTPAPPSVLALTDGLLIDGTGAAPVPDATVLIEGDRIAAVGTSASVAVPAGARTIDLAGATILPGFINAHVHQGFSEANLRAWAEAGVTTVRDLGASPAEIDGLRDFRARVSADPHFARLVSFGSMLSVPGGYGQRFAGSAAEFRAAVDDEFAKGVDGIVIGLEDGPRYDFVGTLDSITVSPGAVAAGPLPNPTAEELRAAVESAHGHGLRVSGHLTQGVYMDALLDAGVDDISHLPIDVVSNESLARMARLGVPIIPTFAALDNVHGSGQRDALMYVVKTGGKVALGNDYAGGPGDDEIGIPYSEFDQMAEAGMEPMDVLLASTSVAARVCGLDGRVGVLAPGYAADVLVVSGNPLDDLRALQRIRMVVRSGTIVRDEALTHTT